MSVLKMFFCIVSETQSSDITIHRDLNSIYTLWETEKSNNKIGIIHIGFIRPKVPSYDEIQHFYGAVLVSSSVKWALPEGYNTSNKAVIEHDKLPLFQLIKGFGYDIALDDDELFSEQPSIETSAHSESNHTIASAALEVLESVAKPMSKEEIYGHIIEQSLFQFGAKKPIHVLNFELNRHCEGTDYSQASSSKFFGKNKAGLFFALSTVPKEFEGWLKELPELKFELAKACQEVGIHDVKSYSKNNKLLSTIQLRELEIFRYQELKQLIEDIDPSKLIPILPTFILDSNISQLDLPARTSNVFYAQNILKLKEIEGFSLQRMMNWPNFGKKSAKDLYDVLDASVTKFYRDSSENLPDFIRSKSDMSNNWIKGILTSNSESAKACINNSIFDEKSYFENKQFLSDTQVRELELIRYHTLKRSINIEDPSELIPLLPTSILEAHITQLGLTVRTSNVFNVQSIFILKDAIGYSLEDMMKWANFGKKSAKDLCKMLDASVEKLSYTLPVNSGDDNTTIINVHNDEKIGKEATEAPNFEHASQTTLKKHFENSLSLLKANERTILEGRTGYNSSVKTLEEMGAVIGVTRERVRQIQKKNVEKIIKTEFWDDCIAIKIGELLLSREQPLYLEMLEVEDAWFSGFIGNYQHLAAIIGLFSENQIKILTIEGSVIISRVCQDDWDTLVRSFKRTLKNKAKEQSWTKNDINLTFKASLDEKGATELLPVLWNIFTDSIVA